MADAKALTDIATSYTTLVGGDLFGVERSGVVGKFTWNDFQDQNITFTGTINFSNTTAINGVLAVASDIQHVGDGDNKIAFTADAQSFETGGSSRLDISNGGIRMGGANARVTTILDSGDTSSSPDTELVTVGYMAANPSNSANYQAFTSSGTWTKPGGLSDDAMVIVEMWGGGGGGGLYDTGTPNESGGGGGAYARLMLRGSQLGATETIIVGAGGAAGAPNGGNGGTSSFGSFMPTAPGGQGGSSATSTGAAGGGKTTHGEMWRGGDGGTGAVDNQNGIYGGGGGGGQAGGSTNGASSSLFAGGGAATGGGAGSVPAGGGGSSGATPGAGARGEVRVWVL